MNTCYVVRSSRRRDFLVRPPRRTECSPTSTLFARSPGWFRSQTFRAAFLI